MEPVAFVETSELNADMFKFESSQKEESRTQSTFSWARKLYPIQLNAVFGLNRWAVEVIHFHLFHGCAWPGYKMKTQDY